MPFNAYSANLHLCTVFFTDPKAVSHAVEVATLYEAAMLAVAEFRRARLFDVYIGPGTRLQVAMKQSEAVHQLQFGKLQEWLEGGARSPNEQVTKARLPKVLVGPTAAVPKGEA